VRLLDLFCCAGGASKGFADAGFEVVGVDIDRQPRYPFQFIRADARVVSLEGFDVIAASPPCQAYSDLQKQSKRGYTDLIGPIRERLIAAGVPYVIENVEGAPLRRPRVMLCGTMFPGLRVIRHRLFESNVLLAAPRHPRHPLVFTHDKRKAHHSRLDQDRSYVQVTGGGNATLANKRDAMGIDWMNAQEINEAIPPAYTEFIGRQLLRAAERPRAAVTTASNDEETT
jgi:DNA (cytosine-5)-methyltransferase 1